MLTAPYKLLEKIRINMQRHSSVRYLTAFFHKIILMIIFLKVPRRCRVTRFVVSFIPDWRREFEDAIHEHQLEEQDERLERRLDGTI